VNSRISGLGLGVMRQLRQRRVPLHSEKRRTLASCRAVAFSGSWPRIKAPSNKAAAVVAVLVAGVGCHDDEEAEEEAGDVELLRRGKRVEFGALGAAAACLSSA